MSHPVFGIYIVTSTTNVNNAQKGLGTHNSVATGFVDRSHWSNNILADHLSGPHELSPIELDLP